MAKDPKKKAVKKAAPAKRATKKEEVEEKEVKKPAKKVAEKKPAKKTKQPKLLDDTMLQTLELMNAEAIIEEVETHNKVTRGSTDLTILAEARVSTGLLMTDIMLAGGIYPGGWYTVAGGEGSGKSTHLMSWLGSLAQSPIPLLSVWDYEGTMTPDYIQNILRTQGHDVDVNSLFGVKGIDGEWIVPPRMYYYNETEGEKFYKTMSSILARLPDKINLDGTWYLAFDNSKENMSRLKGRYRKHRGKLLIESPNGAAMQAIILLDSYPAMTPESDADDDGSNALAQDARMHSKHAKKVWSKLKKKMATVIGVNQLRVNPGVRFGNPNYEPGGAMLKHVSSARIQQFARSIPEHLPGKGPTLEEDSVTCDGGTDTYRYICMRAVKNKLGIDGLEIWHKLWISDADGQGNGYCPVFDTMQYLEKTGQMVKGKKTFDIIMTDGTVIEGMTYMDMKSLLLLRGADFKALLKEWEIKDPKIREKCFKQMASGEGQKLFFAHKSNK